MIMRKSLQYSKLRTKKTPPDHKSAQMTDSDRGGSSMENKKE